MLFVFFLLCPHFFIWVWLPADHIDNITQMAQPGYRYNFRYDTFERLHIVWQRAFISIE